MTNEPDLPVLGKKGLQTETRQLIPAHERNGWACRAYGRFGYRRFSLVIDYTGDTPEWWFACCWQYV